MHARPLTSRGRAPHPQHGHARQPCAVERRRAGVDPRERLAERPLDGGDSDAQDRWLSPCFFVFAASALVGMEDRDYRRLGASRSRQRRRRGRGRRRHRSSSSELFFFGVGQHSVLLERGQERRLRLLPPSLSLSLSLSPSLSAQSINNSRSSGRAPCGRDEPGNEVVGSFLLRGKTKERGKGANLKRRENEKMKKNSFFSALSFFSTSNESLHQNTQNPHRHNAFRPRGAAVRACEYRDLGIHRCCFRTSRAESRRDSAAFFLMQPIDL